MRTCAPLVLLGLCPKLKYPPLCGGIFICHSVVLSLPRPRAHKLAGDGAGAERPLRGMKRSGCPVNKGALQAIAPQGDYCELRTYWVLARISVAQCERYGRISCR